MYYGIATTSQWSRRAGVCTCGRRALQLAQFHLRRLLGLFQLLQDGLEAADLVLHGSDFVVEVACACQETRGSPGSRRPAARVRPARAAGAGV